MSTGPTILRQKGERVCAGSSELQEGLLPRYHLATSSEMCLAWPVHPELQLSMAAASAPPQSTTLGPELKVSSVAIRCKDTSVCEAESVSVARYGWENQESDSCEADSQVMGQTSVG